MNVRQNLRFALRTLLHSRGFTVAAILTLGLGIGLATAVFTIAEALLVRPLPVRAQDRLVVLWGITADGRTDHFPLLYRDAQEFARSTSTLERVEFFSFGGAQPIPMRVGDGILRLRRSLVSGGYFDLLGTHPLIGRALRPEDDVTGAAPVAVLSYAGWQRFFGGDSDVIGRRVAVHGDATAYTIVGVMPRGLDYPQGVDIWSAVVPSSHSLGDQPIYAELNVIGRLRPGVTIANARDEITRFFDSHSAKSWQVRGVARLLSRDIVGNVRPAVLAFAAAAGLLLFITWINVANLMIVRGLARIRELALRIALGAGRMQLASHLVIESAIVAVAGGLLGAAFAVAAVRGFVLVAPSGTPRLDEIRIGGPVLLGATAITALAVLLFSLAPMLLSSRVDPQEAFRSGSRQSGPGRRVRLATHALVVGQMSLAVLVLSAAGLVARSFVALDRVEVAFDPEHLLVAELSLPRDYVGAAPRQLSLLEQVVPRVASLPGVRSVAPALTPPLVEVGGIFGRIPAEGQTPEEVARNPALTYELATPEFFPTFGIKLVRGRLFTDADRKGTLPVAIVSEAVARYYWPGDDPIGKRLNGAENWTIVGVVGDTHYRDLRNPRPSLYLPLSQSIFPSFVPTTLVIATTGRPADLVPALRRIVADADPGVAIAGAATLESFVAGALAQPKLNALLLGIFAGAALLLAAIGLFGVMATSVRQRTSEIGVRIALGATPAKVRASVLSRAVALAGAGAVLGVVASLASTRALHSLLFNVSATDSTTLATVCVVLIGVAMVAAYLPARRAQAIDPLAALRAE